MSKSPELLDTLPGEQKADGLSPTLDATPRPAFGAPTTSGEHLPYRSWERYQITAFLGIGGMGAVYKARDPRLKRSVAIKFLRGSQADAFDTRQRRRFEREASAQARIEHPHICKIYEVGEIDNQPYIVMQLIQGASLAGLQQVLSREDKIRVVLQVAEALHAAHTQNLIHRDLKPANIMVERRPDGTWWPYLLDFGLAKEVDSNSQSSTGGVEGTPAYMAPEQARAETRALDVRTDVYGLGATLFAAVAGRPPFVGNSTDVLLAVLLAEPPPLRTFDPAAPRALQTILAKCMEKEPSRRYHSAQALADDLRRLLDGSPIDARPPGLLRRAVRFVQRHKLLLASVITGLLVSLVLGGFMLRSRWQAAQQARLGQKLGQEITKMEWLLRSGRQMPLHDLNREKQIIRRRMSELQAELESYGALSRGLAHYALGRGHMALHEYPQALVQLRSAMTMGMNSAEVHYALGFVLGKHFEQAMYEARLSGGGDWAKKQLSQLEAQYLRPAIDSLQRSRTMKVDAPQYLEGLIAYYRRDYDAALQQADAALLDAPWLYEASKLSGDVHLERALQARDNGRKAEAEREFQEAVNSFRAAAAVGQSDGEVYEGLAETWVRQIEMQLHHGQPIEAAFSEAMTASEKLSLVEPQSVAGPLKKAYALMFTNAVLGSVKSSTERARLCIAAAEQALNKQPEHPYAREVAASCHLVAADAARGQGDDPIPWLRKALSLLEPAVAQNTHFLWGLNDLACSYLTLATELQLRGDASAEGVFHKALERFSEAAALDPTYVNAPSAALMVLKGLLTFAHSEAEEARLLSSAEDWMRKCMAISADSVMAVGNYFLVYAVAASRALLAGRSPQVLLDRSSDYLTRARKINDSALDVEQHAVLMHLVEARWRLRQKQDPTASFGALQSDLERCVRLADQDAMCRTLAAQAELVRGQWLAAQNKAVTPALEAALQKAQRAVASLERYPDAWQTLAEAHLRLAAQAATKVRALQLRDGLAALDKAFAINPNHPLAVATQGALMLLRAQDEVPGTRSPSSAEIAVQAFERALKLEPLLAHDYAAQLDAARATFARQRTEDRR